MTKYCLLCEEEGHQTDECHSTHSLGSPRVQEIIRLRPMVFGDCLACNIRDRNIGQTPDQSVTPEYRNWLATKSRSAGVGGNEAWNAGVAWKASQAPSNHASSSPSETPLVQEEADTGAFIGLITSWFANDPETAKRILRVELARLKSLPVEGEPVGEVDYLSDTGECNEARLYKPLPWGTKLYASPPETEAMLLEARKALGDGLWDYGPGQDEHDACTALCKRIDVFLGITPQLEGNE